MSLENINIFNLIDHQFLFSDWLPQKCAQGTFYIFLKTSNVFFFSLNEVQRTHQSVKSDMREALERGHDVNGIKGPSPMIALNHFNLSYGFVIDYMHAVLIGVVMFLFDLWFDSKNHFQPFYLGPVLQYINEDLKKLKRPRSQTRPLNITDYKAWKANQVRFFLFVAGYPVLKKYMKKKYLLNFLSLSNGVFILCKDEISNDEFRTASLSIENFVKTFESCYGLRNMRFNVHLVSHLPECVKVMGNLFCYSMFSFESKNGFLGKVLSGTKDIVKELSRKYCVVSKYFQNIENRQFKNNRYEKIDGSLIPVLQKEVATIPYELLTFFNSSHNIKEVKHVFLNNIYFESEKSEKITSDCYIQLIDHSVGKILKIYLQSNMVYFFIEKVFIFSGKRYQFNFVKANKQEQKEIVMSCNAKKIFFMENLKCYSYFPNNFESD